MTNKLQILSTLKLTVITGKSILPSSTGSHTFPPLQIAQISHLSTLHQSNHVISGAF